MGETLEPMTAMRRGIAEHMRRSLDTSAHVTSAIEVDMSRVVALRKKLKPEYERAHGVNVTYLAFIARAAVETLKEYPWINGELRGESIVTRSDINLGFAVELTDGKGLIVPVLKNAETLNLLGIAKGVADIAERARSKKLLPDEVQGGTFTITNPGGYGTFHGTPVISQPQAGDPRHVCGRQAPVGHPGRAGPGCDRDPADHEPDAHVRPSPRRRRPRRAFSSRHSRAPGNLGRSRLLAVDALTGACLCGAVRFEVTEPFERVAACHCDTCKKLSGGGGTVNGRVRTEAIRLLAGEDLVKTFQPEEGSAKTFCSECGSNLFGAGWPKSEFTSVRLPGLEEPYDGEIESHIFVRSLAPWEVLPDDGAERFDVRGG